MAPGPPPGQDRMMLLIDGDPPEVWSAHADMRAEAHEVLAALTDPELIAAWAPVGFELADGCPRRLRAGSRERVSGSLAGVRARFEIEVHRAGPDRLELVAEGPVSMDVAYRLRERDGHVLVDASVGLRRRHGLTAKILRAAVVALLNAGALDRALQSLAESVRAAGRELAAA